MRCWSPFCYGNAFSLTFLIHNLVTVVLSLRRRLCYDNTFSFVCSILCHQVVGPGVSSNKLTIVHEETSIPESNIVLSYVMVEEALSFLLGGFKYKKLKSQHSSCVLALAYGNSFDFEEDSIANDSHESNVINSISGDASDAGRSLSNKSMVPFVLSRAYNAIVEQQLRPIGGAHILLLCHLPNDFNQARDGMVAIGKAILTWLAHNYWHTSKEDKERIQSALDSEKAIPRNGDWAIKLGINLFYSANLSCSPLYRKKIPNNFVIYYAFGCSSLASSPVESKVYPLLAKKDYDYVEDEKLLLGWLLPDEKIERSENTSKRKNISKKSSKKRKMTTENG
ncbi:hypothetical protein VNO78_34783 [Psophocarpus tetragonolobus]|uniref:Uncharacterized protein n=1 Tax=Psophocarpus tetragonolobus TaxID=3891 RepID=A0AAN9NP34_PSOTE